MALPLFPPESDPGPDFVGLLRQAGTIDEAPAAPAIGGRGSSGNGSAGIRRRRPEAGFAGAPHATTVVALRYADGVIMAGDRRATMGNIIAHRSMEKVFAADRFSAVAIAGSAGMAVEMVRLFQVQLEHYEKVEGTALSLEGKANQLAQMVRQNLPLAMQGLVVVPLFAGYDTARGIGRIYSYDATGGHYEDTDFQSTGSGGRDARSTIKLGCREGLSRDEAVDLAIQSLYDAADEDSATGGPDLVRGIYPLIAVVDAEGYRLVPEEEVAERFGALIARRRAEQTADAASRAEQASQATAARPAPSEGGGPMSMPYYVAPEQVMKDRAEYAQKGIARGRSLVATTYDLGIVIVAENPSRSLHKISEIYDRIAFGGVGKYNEYDQLRVAGVRHADTKGYAYSREDVDARSLANLYAQYLGNVFTHEMKPLEVEILVAELGAGQRPDQLYHIAYEGTITDEEHFAVLGGDAETITERVAATWQADWDLAAALKAATAALAGPDRTLAAGDLEVATLSRGNGRPDARRTFRRIADEELALLLA